VKEKQEERERAGDIKRQKELQREKEK